MIRCVFYKYNPIIRQDCEEVVNEVCQSRETLPLPAMQSTKSSLRLRLYRQWAKMALAFALVNQGLG